MQNLTLMTKICDRTKANPNIYIGKEEYTHNKEVSQAKTKQESNIVCFTFKIVASNFDF